MTSVWLIPIFLTVLMFLMIYRPYKPSAMFDIGPIERVLWIIPIVTTWIIFGIWLWRLGK